MKKLITANDIREAHARGEQAMSVVLRASIITPEAREVDAPRDKCAHFREINGIAAAFQHLQKNYIPAALSFL